MTPGHDDLTLHKGYQFKAPYRYRNTDLTGYEIRFRIFGIDGSDFVATVASGHLVDVDLALPATWTVLIDGITTNNFIAGQYPYAQDLKAPGEDYEPYVTGTMRVLDLGAVE